MFDPLNDVEKKRIVLLIADQVEEWGDDNDVAMSQIDEIELAQRIFNILPEILQNPPQ